jgi:hypothetical protein
MDWVMGDVTPIHSAVVYPAVLASDNLLPDGDIGQGCIRLLIPPGKSLEVLFGIVTHSSHRCSFRMRCRNSLNTSNALGSTDPFW